MTIYKAIEKAMEGQRVRTNTIFGECIIETDNKGNFFLRERDEGKLISATLLPIDGWEIHG